jgi:hypothetical protein
VSVILAIDPGYTESAWLLYDTEAGQPVEWAKEDNERVRRVIIERPSGALSRWSRCMAVGRDASRLRLASSSATRDWPGSGLRATADVKLLCRAKDKSSPDSDRPVARWPLGRKASPVRSTDATVGRRTHLPRNDVN